MWAAFLTTVFFSLSVIFASRSAKILGGPRANAARITVALVFLAAWAHGFGAGVRGPALWWFIASGIIGFGMGDIGLFGAITRIGPRLSILLTQCLAAPIAAVAEWAWLGTQLHLAEAACAVLILAGVALALAPDHGWEGERRVFWVGVIFGLVSALGQALGAVLSRKAYEVSTSAHFSIDGWSAAYQRILGGAVTIWIFTWLLGRSSTPNPAPVNWRRAWAPVVGNALAGPVVGVGCFQLALQTRATGIVLPIVSISPLVTMVLSFFIDGLRPSRRAVLGGLMAVAGAVVLKRLQTA